MVRVRVLGVGFCVRVRIIVTGSVSYLNKKFVVVLAFVAPFVNQNALPGGDRCGGSQSTRHTVNSSRPKIA